ncbi:MAG: EF-hand domain-containing protein [Burkholderiales bacterium]|nr:EF-hand domain-containing protein [Burkholderiales bacterium]MDE2300440.1 EF-hand domain-containing protein [Burkholderiales bacterium]MDE2625840.1 EF-hand domain-containing protein [Burkholderiales bacterium]
MRPRTTPQESPMNRILPFHAMLRTAFVAAAWAGLAAAAMAQPTTLPESGEPPPAAEPSATGRAALEEAFTRADANADGFLSRDEVARMPAVAARFDELDKNKDGVLSLEEFAAGATAGVN